MSEHVSADCDALRAEVEHWKAHAEEAGRGFTQVCKDYARSTARNAELVRRVETLLAKYEGRSKWVGYEGPRREAWAEIESDLRAVIASAEGDAP